jgi:hypothetical protein
MDPKTKKWTLVFRQTMPHLWNTKTVGKNPWNVNSDDPNNEMCVCVCVCACVCVCVRVRVGVGVGCWGWVCVCVWGGGVGFFCFVLVISCPQRVAVSLLHFPFL